METIAELEQYLERECYNFQWLSIGGHRAPEGAFIEKAGNEYVFGYSERGKREVLASFPTERELVDYAFRQLTADRWHRGHLVAWVWSEAEILEAEEDLRRRGIPWERNDIPNYRPGRRAYRIFVFGRDLLRLGDFKEKYLKH